MALPLIARAGAAALTVSIWINRICNAFMRIFRRILTTSAKTPADKKKRDVVVSFLNMGWKNVFDKRLAHLPRLEREMMLASDLTAKAKVLFNPKNWDWKSVWAMAKWLATQGLIAVGVTEVASWIWDSVANGESDEYPLESTPSSATVISREEMINSLQSMDMPEADRAALLAVVEDADIDFLDLSEVPELGRVASNVSPWRANQLGVTPVSSGIVADLAEYNSVKRDLKTVARLLGISERSVLNLMSSLANVASHPEMVQFYLEGNDA